ncbi:protein LURP-one-related 6-like [Prunus persica]|uniref:protein LURP-one-related 6-like n=1 Tax=Prunus persica TaxID=3760 RepID=UPI0009AB6167|nr:protein LURP-one-related 6-like [Prunus persica]
MQEYIKLTVSAEMKQQVPSSYKKRKFSNSEDFLNLIVKEKVASIPLIGIRATMVNLLMIFYLKEPNSCLARTHAIRISTKARQNKDWDFEIKGYFPDKDCRIVDSRGNTMAHVIIPVHERIYKKFHCLFLLKFGVKKELMASKDLYHVVVTPDMDQAFVIGVITILDYIYVESTRC